MPQTTPLIETLKVCLKAERKTYADIAKLLALSEASVKRLFATEDFTLARLDAICQMLGMEVSDLVQKMNDSRHRLERLSPQQERELIEDVKLMIVTVCIFNRWTVQQIIDAYVMSEAECVRKLVRLDQLKIIELLPANRVKLLISPNFKWLENGPIEQFFRQTIGKEFFDTDFGQQGECLMVLNGMLSAESSIEFQRKLERIAKEYNDLNDHDAALPFAARKGTTLMMAMRNWEYGFFQHMQRKLPS